MTPTEVKLLYLGIPALVLGLLTQPILTLAVLGVTVGGNLAYCWWQQYSLAKARYELIENQARWKREHAK